MAAIETTLTMTLDGRSSRYLLAPDPVLELGRQLGGREGALLLDGAVARRHGPLLRRLGTAGGRAPRPSLTLPGGEQVKTVARLEQVYRWLARIALPRDGCLVAVGGGAILDLAGLAAATWHRGVTFFSLPTTLLAMVDAAIGGKTAIDLDRLKNPVGAFHPARAILVHTPFLATLPRREWRNGQAELIKTAIIGSRPLFTAVHRRRGTLADLLAAGPAGRTIPAILDVLPWHDWIRRAARIKGCLVTSDFREGGPRRALNLGHTLGHALEAHLGCSHGEAVAMGLAAVTRLAVRRGLCPADEGRRIVELLAASGLPVTAPPLPRGALRGLLARDKKRQAGLTRWVLPAGVGDIRLDQQVDLDEILPCLRD